MHHDDETHAKQNVNNVLKQRDEHGNLRGLQPHKPAVECIKRQHGRSTPNANREIGVGGGSDFGRRMHHPQSNIAQGALQHDEEHAHPNGYEERTHENGAHGLPIATAESLRRHAAVAHAQEAQQPIEHIENHGAHGYGTDINLRP